MKPFSRTPCPQLRSEQGPFLNAAGTFHDGASAVLLICRGGVFRSLKTVRVAVDVRGALTFARRGPRRIRTAIGDSDAHVYCANNPSRKSRR